MRIREERSYGLAVLAQILGLCVGVALVYEVLIHYIKFDLIGLSVAGMVLGAIYWPLSGEVEKKKIRKHGKVIIFGLIAVLVLFSARYLVRGALVHRELLTMAQNQGIDESEMNRFLREETHAPEWVPPLGLAFLMDLKNTSLTHNGHGSRKPSIEQGLLVVGIEIVIALWMIFGLPASLAYEYSFCEECDEKKVWKSTHSWGSAGLFRDAKEALKTKKLALLKSLRREPETKPTNFTAMEVHHCPRCPVNVESSKYDVILKGRKKGRNKKHEKRYPFTFAELRPWLEDLQG